MGFTLTEIEGGTVLFYLKGDARSKTEAFMIGLQGSFLLSKIHRNKRYMKTFRKQIEKIIN